jgi:hypothetical protein
MNDEAQIGVKGAGNRLLIRASSLIGHSSFACHACLLAKTFGVAQRGWVIRHFPPRYK